MSDEPKNDPTRPGNLVIQTAGRILVSIGPDGTLTYGEGYTPDEAAKTFWEAMAAQRVDYEARLLFLAHVEELLARVGEQDLRVEAARLKAEETKSPPDRFSAERAMDQLNVLWHELVEFARGIAYRNRHNKEEDAKAETMAPQKRFLN